VYVVVVAASNKKEREKNLMNRLKVIAAGKENHGIDKMKKSPKKSFLFWLHFNLKYKTFFKQSTSYN
jgi:hypothetical protein